MSRDRYSSFDELKHHEALGKDYTLTFKDAGSRVTIIAPHGGKIEPRTSDLARRIAGDNYNFYCFEGIKASGNACLHITSHRFDEPGAVELVARSEVVVAVHACTGTAGLVHIGGLNKKLGRLIGRQLQKSGIAVSNDHPRFKGSNPANICNRGQTGVGVQLEVTRDLRDDPQAVEKIARAVRAALSNYVTITSNEILQDLFFIERGFLNGNHFVYRSDAPVLIDTGYISGFEETRNTINRLGVNLSDIALIISTHTHCDHIGGNNRIQRESGCDIALHRVGRYFIDTRDDWSTWWRYYNQDAEFFTCTRSLEDGEMVSLGPHEFEVIYTPGHAADGIVLYNRHEKVLISSDTLWQTDMAVMTLRVEGSRALFDMQASLEKIEKLDVQMVYPGHGKPFADMPKAIARSKQRIQNFLKHPDAIGDDLLKKIIVYTLMMKKVLPADALFDYLMATHWYKETVDLYFNGRYESKYDDVINSFLGRGIIKEENGYLSTTVKP